MSCGAYHTAAVSEDGALFTWGNGLFGKLGHGDTASALVPRRCDDRGDRIRGKGQGTRGRQVALLEMVMRLLEGHGDCSDDSTTGRILSFCSVAKVS